MASQQATGDTSGQTFSDAPTEQGGGNNIDMASQQAPIGTTAQNPDSGALPTQQTGGNNNMADEQDPVGTTANSSGQEAPNTPGTGGNNDMASQQAPLGTTGNTSDLPGANNQEEAMGGRVNNQGAAVDNSFDAQAKNSKDTVVGGFRKLLNPSNNQGGNDDSFQTQVHNLLNPSNNQGVDDDSFQTQVRNRSAQVKGTIQGLGDSLKLAGQKAKGTFSKDSSKTT